MLSINTKQFFEFELDGEKVRLRKPTQGDLEELERKVEESGGKGQTKIINEYLASLGMDIEKVKTIPQDLTTALLKEINGEKKS